MPTRIFSFYVALVFAVFASGPADVYADGGDHPLVQIIDGYRVTLAFDAEQAQTGTNELVVTLDTADGAPVTDATVTAAVVAYAPAEAGHSASHGAKAAPAPMDRPGEHQSHDMEADDHSAHQAAPAASQAPAPNHDHTAGSGPEGHGQAGVPSTLLGAPQPGSYRGALALDQAGTATITIAFTIAGKGRAGLFSVPVSQSRPRALVLGGFAAVNGLVILAAAVLKRRAPQKQLRKTAAAPAGAVPLTARPTSAEQEHAA